ncbi:GNAT family N-acetyltransferase [Guggenheimella bovis]
MNLEEMSATHAIALSDILTNDTNLALSMGLVEPEIVSPEEYYKLAQSLKEDAVDTFTIKAEEKVIGVISLCPVDEKTALVGGWIRSDEWNKGYGTEALELTKEKAKEKGYRFLTSNIDKENEVALKLWKRFPILLREDRRHYHPWMEL